MTRILALTVVLAGFLLGAAACGSDDDVVEADDLDGTSWGDPMVEGNELAGTLEMAFESNRVSVTGGCNTLTGGYTIDDGVLTAGPLAATMMACDEPLMNQDMWIAGLLEAGLEVALDGDELTLAEDGTTITMQRSV